MLSIKSTEIQVQWRGAVDESPVMIHPFALKCFILFCSFFQNCFACLKNTISGSWLSATVLPAKLALFCWNLIIIFFFRKKNKNRVVCVEVRL